MYREHWRLTQVPSRSVGYATVVHLLQRNISHVIVACRSVEKGEAAKEKMLAAMSDCEQSRISVWKLDLASFESVRTFAGRLNTELERLDILILNAGLSTEAWRMSVDGYEESLQVNAIATGFLSLLAAPVLQCTAARHIEAKPHLAIVVSEGVCKAAAFSPNARGEEADVAYLQGMTGSILSLSRRAKAASLRP